MASLALGFVLIAGLLAAPNRAFADTEDADAEQHLELVEIDEVADENGLITFTATVQNTHDYRSMRFVRVVITLKREGLVVDFLQALCTDIEPGGTGFCSRETEFTQEDYDELRFRVEGSMKDPDPSMLTGKLTLIEDSLNLTATVDGSTLFLGELFNGTNAILTHINVDFSLFDAQDRFLGIAEEPPLASVFFKDVRPNETISFVAWTEDVPFAKVERWEVAISHSIERYEVPAIPTATTEATWGQIKQQRGGRE